MDFNKIYQNIIQNLKADKRPSLKLDDSELEKLNLEIRQHFRVFLESNKADSDRKALTQRLCIANFLTKPKKELWPVIYEILENSNDKDITVTTIGLSEKHIVGWHELNGEAMAFDFIKVLKKLVYSNEAEVQEWALRVIAGVGSKAIILKSDLQKTKPGLKRFVNPHAKSSYQIIEMLLKRWSD